MKIEQNTIVQDNIYDNNLRDIIINNHRIQLFKRFSNDAKVGVNYNVCFQSTYDYDHEFNVWSINSSISYECTDPIPEENLTLLEAIKKWFKSRK